MKSLRSFIEQNLKESARLVIYNRLGVYGRPKTLEETGIVLGNISRQRVGQIESKTYRKILSGFENGVIKEEDLEIILIYAQKIDFIDNIHLRNKDYSSEVFIQLIVNSFKNKLGILDNDIFGKRRIIYDKNFNTKKNLDELIENLRNAESFQELKALEETFKIPKHLIIEMNGIVLDGNCVALKSNRRIFYYEGSMSKVLQVLRENGKPMNLKEIAYKSKLSFNQVRGAIDRVPGAVNIGLSIYALKDWGYLEGDISDIAYYYLVEAGEPMTMKNLTSLILKQKIVRSISVYLAIQRDSRFVQLDTGYWALKIWGYENEKISQHRPLKEYPVSSEDALCDILSQNDDYLSVLQLRDLVIEKYGKKVSHNHSLYYLLLQDFVREGTVDKINKGRFCYYRRKGL